MEVQFRDDMTVELIKSSASDLDVIRAARVSTVGVESTHIEEDQVEEARGLIRFLMKNRHSSPLEHSTFTFYIECPLFVVREIHRHRIASYNEWSGRYSQLAPTFYVPNKERNLVQIGKAGHYEYVPGNDLQYSLVKVALQESAVYEYEKYLELLDAGIAKEVARMALPIHLYTAFYMTINARSLMNFLSLRVKSDTSLYKSFPMREIEMVAEKMEDIFKQHMPIVHEYFEEFGRVSP